MWRMRKGGNAGGVREFEVRFLRFEGLLIIRVKKSQIGVNHIIGLQGGCRYPSGARRPKRMGKEVRNVQDVLAVLIETLVSEHPLHGGIWGGLGAVRGLQSPTPAPPQLAGHEAVLKGSKIGALSGLQE